MQQTSYHRKGAPRRAQTPEQQLASAIDRAERDHITVAGSGTLADGRKFWLVASQSVQGMHHVVTQHGKSLQCDCIYSQMQHKVCVHRAAAYLFLRAAAIAAVNEAREVASQAPVEKSAPLVAKPQPAAPARSSTPVTPAPDAWDAYQDARMDSAIYAPVSSR